MTEDPSAHTSVAADLDSAFYWEAAAAGRLVAQRCAGCRRLWHPPGPACPHCHGLAWTIADLPDRGTIYSVALVHEPGSPVQGTHYLVALVELLDPDAEGSVRIAANIRGGDLTTATIGAPVELYFEALAGDGRLPQFRLASPSAGAT